MKKSKYEIIAGITFILVFVWYFVGYQPISKIDIAIMIIATLFMSYCLLKQSKVDEKTDKAN